MNYLRRRWIGLALYVATGCFALGAGMMSTASEAQQRRRANDLVVPLEERVSVNGYEVRYKMQVACTEYGSTTHVRVRFADRTLTQSDQVTERVIERGRDYFLKNCANKPYSLCMVLLSDHAPGTGAAGGCFEQKDGYTRISRYSNNETDRARANAAAAAARQRQRDQEAARIAAADAARRQTEDRWNAFANASGVKQLVPSETLVKNPFKFEKQTVAFIAKFEQMIAADQALFSVAQEPILVSGVPKTRFGESKYSVLIAGTVLGTTTAKIPPFGEMSVPHVQYVNAYDCSAGGCSDILPKQ